MRQQHSLTALVRSFAVALCVVACGSAPQPTEHETMNKRIMPPTSYEAGPAITSSHTLLSWLKERSSDVRLRVPVVFERSALGIMSATIAGTQTSDTPLRLAIDDTRLGISLAMRLDALCPATGPCSAWIEGYWGPGILPVEPEKGTWPFQVVASGDLVDSQQEVLHIGIASAPE